MVWYEKLTGSLEEKRKYRERKARLAALPEPYRTSAEALERYCMYAGGIAKGDVVLTMMSDLSDLIEQAAAHNTPVRDVVGDDPVVFAEEFLENYRDGQWISKERTRLTEAIDKAVGDRP